MTAYFEENRFSAVGKHSSKTQISSERPHPITLQSKGFLREVAPTIRQDPLAMSNSALGHFESMVNAYADYQRIFGAYRVVGSLESELPAGKKYDVYITNPGSVGGEEDVTVLEHGAPVLSENQMKFTIEGQNRTTKNPTKVKYTGPNGTTVNIPVGPPEPKPSPRKSLSIFVIQEPRGVPARPERQDVQPDSRLDRDHPLHRDPKGLA